MEEEYIRYANFRPRAVRGALRPDKRLPPAEQVGYGVLFGLLVDVVLFAPAAVEEQPALSFYLYLVYLADVRTSLALEARHLVRPL